MFQSDLHSVMMLARQSQAELRQAAASGRMPRRDRMARYAVPPSTRPETAAAPVMHAWLRAVSGRRAPEGA